MPSLQNYSLPNQPIDPLIEDEILIIETSGEMPEVAYHSSIYYLTNDPEGPQLTITTQTNKILQAAAAEGFRRIILRDITLQNRQQSIYRGLERSVVNWQRLNIFCERMGMGCEIIKKEIRQSLKKFLIGEINDVLQYGNKSCLNCPTEVVLEFMKDIGLKEEELPTEWRQVIHYL